MILLALIGCTSEFNLATNRTEQYIYSTEREMDIGAKVAYKLEKKFEIITDIDVNQRIKQIFDRIVAKCDRQDIVYFVKVVDLKEEDKEEFDEDFINAFALPGGHVYIFKDLIDFAETDNQIAGVIAHEIGHITARHGVKNLQKSYAALLTQLAVMEAGGNVSAGVGLAIQTMFTEHSQDAELEADKLGVDYMQRAGYDPNGMVQFLERLHEEQNKDNPRPIIYWRSHPHIPQRIATVRQKIKGKLEFEDYLLLIGN